MVPLTSHFSPSSGTGSPESGSSSSSTTPRAVDLGGTPSASISASSTPQSTPERARNNASAKTKAKRKTSYFPVQKAVSPTGDVEFYPPPLTGSTEDVRAMTGLVGSRAWERWMVKLAREMGTDEFKSVERIGRALEVGDDGGGGAGGDSGGASSGAMVGMRQGMGWRCLLGWARKPG